MAEPVLAESTRNNRRYTKPKEWYLLPFWLVSLIIVYSLRIPFNAILEVVDFLVNVIKIVLGSPIIVKALRVIISFIIIVLIIYIALKATGQNELLKQLKNIYELIKGWF